MNNKNNDKSNDWRRSSREHLTVLKYPGKPSYPSKADLERLGIQSKGNY